MSNEVEHVIGILECNSGPIPKSESFQAVVNDLQSPEFDSPSMSLLSISSNGTGTDTEPITQDMPISRDTSAMSTDSVTSPRAFRFDQPLGRISRTVSRQDEEVLEALDTPHLQRSQTLTDFVNQYEFPTRENTATTEDYDAVRKDFNRQSQQQQPSQQLSNSPDLNHFQRSVSLPGKMQPHGKSNLQHTSVAPNTNTAKNETPLGIAMSVPFCSSSRNNSNNADDNNHRYPSQSVPFQGFQRQSGSDGSQFSNTELLAPYNQTHQESLTTPSTGNSTIVSKFAEAFTIDETDFVPADDNDSSKPPLRLPTFTSSFAAHHQPSPPSSPPPPSPPQVKRGQGNKLTSSHLEAYLDSLKSSDDSDGLTPPSDDQTGGGEKEWHRPSSPSYSPTSPKKKLTIKKDHSQVKFKKDLKTKASSPTSMYKQRKVHVCEVCQKEFNCASKLKRHETAHTNLKRFHCNVCKSGFTQRASLKVHTKKHALEVQDKSDSNTTHINGFSLESLLSQK